MVVGDGEICPTQFFSLKSTVPSRDDKTTSFTVNSHKGCLAWNILEERGICLGFIEELGFEAQGD